MTEQISHYTAGTDLQFVLDTLDLLDPVDVESEDVSATEWEVRRTLNAVRADVTRRLAVQAGPRQVDYCGVSGEHGRACGAELGLPDCRYHSTCGTCGLNVETGGLFWFRDHSAGGCPTVGVEG